ncbi:hypothetical protein [Deinococcus sp.]|uniref:hypothetical protein n=1 Tax=Deinococcus sp. TaxID=47478 RepID=UPI003CC5AFDF
MDVIINNPAAQTVLPQTYSAPAPTYSTQGYAAPAPYGYAPGYEHHGPGFLLPLLLIGGLVLFLRSRGRQWRNRRRMWAAQGFGPGKPNMPEGGQNAAQQGNEPDWGEQWKRGRERFMGGGLFGDKALDIARERYAKGEIDADQYAELQRNLEKEG